MLVDCHCHLHFPGLTEQCADVINRAQEVGVHRMVSVGTKRREIDILSALTQKHDAVYSCIGVHPHHSGEEGEYLSTAEIAEAAQAPKVIGIGETGLDYFYNSSPQDAQQNSFRRHIRAAQETKLPLVIHSRDAEEDTLRLLREEGPVTGVLHCFSSRRLLAEEGLNLGLMVSFSGILTFKKSQELRDIARDIPMDRILIETDSPYLAPEPFRGKVCEPAHVLKTAECLAEIKGVDPEEIARQTTNNFFRLFVKCPRGEKA